MFEFQEIKEVRADQFKKWIKKFLSEFVRSLRLVKFTPTTLLCKTHRSSMFLSVSKNKRDQSINIKFIISLKQKFISESPSFRPRAKTRTSKVRVVRDFPDVRDFPNAGPRSPRSPSFRPYHQVVIELCRRYRKMPRFTLFGPLQQYLIFFKSFR